MAEDKIQVVNILLQRDFQVWEFDKILRFFRYIQDMGGGLLEDEKKELEKLQELKNAGATKFVILAVKE